MTARSVTLAGWVILTAAVVALEARARLTSPRRATLEDALTAVRSVSVGRIVLLAGWVWLGWHVFAR